jgi:predicted ArsR family transcriptional regulator
MIETTYPRQHEMLEFFLEHKEGLSIEALSHALKISRTAVQRHLSVLESNGYIQKKQTNKTAGRPVGIYALTDQGINYFPKQYAWLSEVIISDLLEEISPERFAGFMQRLGNKVADNLRHRLAGKEDSQKINELINIMTELGYQARAVTENEEGQNTVQAANCIYHDLARKHQQICEFDIALMSSLLNKRVEQNACMAKGDCQCRFVIHK